MVSEKFSVWFVGDEILKKTSNFVKNGQSQGGHNFLMSSLISTQKNTNKIE